MNNRIAQSQEDPSFSIDAASGLVLPWWTRPALSWLLDSHVGGWSVFEWGCGRSSVWFDRHALRYAGIESNHKHVLVPGVLHVPVDQHPHDVESDDSQPPYVTEARRFGLHDLVVVDGIYRRGCFRLAPEIIKPGGSLVIDNANWFDDVVDGLRHKFSGYTRHIDPTHPSDRSSVWATDVYTDFVA